MFRVDPALKEFVESGVAVTVGTANDDGRPRIVSGWGPRVSEDGTVLEVFLDTARAAGPLKNLGANGKIAVVFADPISFRSVQLKGAFLETGPVTELDRVWVERHRELFLITTTLVGDSPTSVRNRWMNEIVRVSFRIERAFDQTPGAKAGTPLAAGASLEDPR